MPVTRPTQMRIPPEAKAEMRKAAKRHGFASLTQFVIASAMMAARMERMSGGKYE